MFQFLRRICLLLAVLTLTGCIEIRDASLYWNKAKADPALEGKWHLHSIKEEDGDAGIYLILKKEKGEYGVTTIEDGVAKHEGKLKTFEFQGYSFVLFKPVDMKVDTRAALMWPYKIENGTLQIFYAPASEDASDKAETIEKLDDAALAYLIKKITGSPPWTADITGRKED